MDVPKLTQINSDELDLVLYWREFKAWYAALSAPARRTLAQLDRDSRLAVAHRAVHMRIHRIIEGTRIPGAVIENQFDLIAA